jgi:hypothetical protein
MIRRYISKIISASLLALTFAAPVHAKRPGPPEVFKIMGDSPALASVIFPLKEAFQSENKMPLLVIEEITPLTGLQEADKGVGDALVVAMPFDELNRLAADSGMIRRNKSLTQFSVLVNEVSYKVIVNPANPVSKLSAKELRRIFSGRYKDWDDVDGTKGPVSIVWGEWSTGASWVLASTVMDDEPIIKNMVRAESISEIVAKVAQDPRAIGIVPTSGLTPAVKALETPELKIEGPIILVTIGFPTSKHFQLIKLIKGEGQRLVGY